MNPLRAASARPRLLIALVVALVGVAVARATGLGAWSGLSMTLAAWNIGAWLYLVLILVMMLGADADGVRRKAALLDNTANVGLALCALSTVMSLLAVVLELAAVHPHGDARDPHLWLSAATVLGSWLFIPTVYGMHYAHVYYRGLDADGEQALRFPEGSLEPDYVDFLYFSFTIAIAGQTSDVSVASRRLRGLVLSQALLSFLFNVSILALTINLSAALLAPS